MTKELEHRLLEAAWRSFCVDVVNPELSTQDLVEMRSVFFTGAVSLWFQLVPLLRDRQWTKEETRQLTIICDELKAFTDHAIAVSEIMAKVQ